MVSSQVSLPDSEPTPAFNERCTSLLRHLDAGDIVFEEAVKAAHALHQEAVETRHAANEARAQHVLGYIQHYRGHISSSIRHYDQARAAFSRLGNKRRIAIIAINQGENYRAKGDLAQARELYRSAYQTASELGFLLLQTTAIANEGQILLTMGRHHEALESLLEAQKLAKYLETDDHVVPRLVCEIHYVLASIYCTLQRLDEAWHEARAALRLAQDMRHPLQIGLAQRAVGEVLMAMETPPEGEFSTNADEYFQVATDIFRSLGAEGEMARTMYVYSKSLARQGRRMTAARKLHQAMIIFTKLGMVNDATQAAALQLTVLGPKG